MPGSEPMTASEIARAIQRLEEGQKDRVTKELHDSVIDDIRGDIREIKDSQKWMMRGIITTFLAVVIQVVVALATRGPF